MAERRRKKKPNRLLPNDLSATDLFTAGMGTLPAFLFQERLDIRILQVMLFAFLVSRTGKRIQWPYFFLMIGSITLFHLFSPWGEVLLRVGPLRITLGALEQGLTKGFTIVGLVFVSLFTIRTDLRLPGRLGGLIGKVFYYYERILEGRGKVDPARLITSLDGILEQLYLPGRVPAAGAAATGDSAATVESAASGDALETGASGGESGSLAGVRRTTSVKGYLFLAGLLILNWGLLAYPSVIPSLLP